MRINKYLASCGVSSRRNSEEFVRAGKVKVNGRVVTDLAFDVKVGRDIVTIDGQVLSAPTQHIYLMLHKPKGYITSTSDEKGRKVVLELLDQKYRNQRLFPIGRLDFDTEGLLLLTTDGDLAHKLTHPSHEVPKTYIVRIEGEMQESDLARLRNGIMLDGRRTNPSRVRVLAFEEGVSRIEIVITEGRNRQVRRMFESLNRDVIFLKRTAVGDIKLGGLSRGASRELTPRELEYLLH